MAEEPQDFAQQAAEQRERLKYEASFDMMFRAFRLKEPQVSGEELKRNECIAAQIDVVLKSEGVVAERIDVVTLRDLIMGNIENILLEPKEHIPRSMLDIKSLGLSENDEIEQYLRSHGIDIAKPKDVFYLLNVIVEAIEYLRDHLLPSKEMLHVNLERILKRTMSALEILESARKKLIQKDGVPKEEVYDTAALNDRVAATHFEPEIYQLFKGSSASSMCDDMERKKLSQQSCGVLRAMAAINFMDRHPLKPYQTKADKTLEAIIDKNMIGWDRQGRSQGELCGISLIESRNHFKTRKRTKGKLLRSAKYGLQIPRDTVGHRFVTKKKSELLRLIYRLYFNPETAIFENSTILIEETKNSLICPKELRTLLSDPDIAYKFFVEEVEPKELGLNIDGDLNGTNGAHGGFNPNSASSYSAIHVTSYIAVTGDDGTVVQFPCEKQYMDADSYQTNEKTHPAYALKQDEQERTRVLSNNAGELNYPEDEENGELVSPPTV